MGAGARRAGGSLREEASTYDPRLRISGLIAAASAAARSWARSRSSVASMTIGPAMPIGAEASPRCCGRVYVREEVLEAESTELLGGLRFDDEVIGWVREAFRPAMPTSVASTRRRSPGCRRNTSASMTAYTPCMSTSSMGEIGGDFYDRFAGEWREEQRHLQREIDRHQQADEFHMDEGVQISNWPETRKSCSLGKNRAKSAVCSISYFRTALGRMAKWSPPSVNRLIYWRKPLLSRRARRRVQAPIRTVSTEPPAKSQSQRSC